MQEDHVQIRTIAQFPPTQLAVADDADGHGAALRAAPHIGTPHCAQIWRSDRSTTRSIMSSAISVSRSLTRISGKRAGQIRDGHAEHRSLLEVPQRLNLAFRVLLLQRIHFQIQFLLELRTSRAGLQKARIDEFIEQQRIGGDLPDQKIPVTADAISRARASGRSFNKA